MSVSSITFFANSSVDVINDHIRNASVYSSNMNEVQMCRELALAVEVATYAISYVNNSGFKNAISVQISLKSIKDTLDTLEKISGIEGIQSKCHRYLNLKRSSDQIEENQTDTAFSKRIRSLLSG